MRPFCPPVSRRVDVAFSLEVYTTETTGSHYRTGKRDFTMMNLTRTHSLFAFWVLGVMLATPSALATVIPVGPEVFPIGSTLLTFTGIPDGTEVNGLTAGGLLFNYSLGNGNVVINGGPGVTNKINPPNIVSTGKNSGILTGLLPRPTDLFRDGYSLLHMSAVSNATN